MYLWAIYMFALEKCPFRLFAFLKKLGFKSSLVWIQVAFKIQFANISFHSVLSVHFLFSFLLFYFCSLSWHHLGTQIFFMQ